MTWLLASGAPLIGANYPGAHLHAETLDRSVWDPDGDPAARGINSLVAVHRLREVACLYGFTRFEPAPLATDELEDVRPCRQRCSTRSDAGLAFGS